MKNATANITNYTGENEIVQRIAEAFEDNDIAIIGAYTAQVIEDGWTSLLVFCHRDTGKIYKKGISSDGPTHAALEAYQWWVKDAWYL